MTIPAGRGLAPPGGKAGRGPIFVVGAPGSGTAAVHAGIVGHSDLWGAGRGEFLAPLFVQLPEVHRSGTRKGRLQWLAAQRVDYPEFAQRIGQGLGHLFDGRATGRRWVDHSPVYGRFLEPLGVMFPGAAVIFVNRDGREVVAALTSRHRRLTHQIACHIWQRYTDAWRRAGQTGLRLLEVRHDRLGVDPDGQLRRIFAFLGEPFEEAPIAGLRTALQAEAPVSWAAWDTATRRTFDEVAGVGLRSLGFAVDSSWVRGAG